MNERHTTWLLLLAIVALFGSSVVVTGQVTRSISGNVVDVFDGDTITVADIDRTEWKVRLAAVDAPELGQSFGKKARKELLELLLGQPVTVTFDRTDAGGQIVGIVQLESQREALVSIFPININQYLVEAGLAWYDRAFQTESSKISRETFSRLEASARQAKKGLWAEKNPIPPWEFRGKTTASESASFQRIEQTSDPVVVANKTSGLYYLSYCPDYGKVPALDQVSFKSASDAKAAGFKLAKSCDLK